MENKTNRNSKKINDKPGPSTNIRDRRKHGKTRYQRVKMPLFKERESTIFKVPQKAEEYSSNWKKLQQVLKKENIDKLSSKNKKDMKSKKRKRLHVPVLESKKKTEDVNAKQEEPETKEPDIWFDDVDEVFLETKRHKPSDKISENPLVKCDSYTGLTKALAVDCEMVGVGPGGTDSVLARVSLVNQYGQCVYDQYVMPQEEVTDYRTHVSGVTAALLKKAEKFSVVQREVSDMLKGRVLVGHALSNDLQVLFLDHPKKYIRDTSRYKPFRNLFNGRNPSLKKLTDKVLNVEVQKGQHSSVQDAQAAMRLYTMVKTQWEKDLKTAKKPCVPKVPKVNHRRKKRGEK